MQTQFVRESMNHYFVVKREGEWEESYEEKLFAVADVPYFMSYEMRQLNGTSALYYHLSFRTSLKQALECVTFSTEKIDNVIKSIVGVLESCYEYLVSPDKILFDTDCVFFDVDTGFLKFCYYYDKKEGGTLKELVMDIIRHVDKRHEKGAVRLLMFYNLLTDTDVDLDKLIKFAGSRENSAIINSDIEVNNEDIQDKKADKDKTDMSDADKKINIGRSIEAKERYNPKEKHIGKTAEKKGMIIQIIKILMGIVALFDVGMLIGLIFNLLTYEKTGYLFIGMAVLIGLVIIYMHFDPEETPEQMMEDYNRSMSNSQKFSNDQYKYDTYETSQKSKENDFIENPDNMNYDGYDGATVLLNGDFSDHCAIEEDTGKLYLEPSDKNKYSPIYISNPSIVLGTMQDVCDFILKGNGISRLHAKLLDKTDGLYVMDMNSTNGTYLNGEMLEAGKEYRLEAGDLVSFADTQFYAMQEC